jgi:hypothetical protein
MDGSAGPGSREAEDWATAAEVAFTVCSYVPAGLRQNPAEERHRVARLSCESSLRDRKRYNPPHRLARSVFPERMDQPGDEHSFYSQRGR